MNYEKQVAELMLENASIMMEVLQLKSIVIEYQKRELSEKIPGLKMDLANFGTEGSAGY